MKYTEWPMAISGIINMVIYQILVPYVWYRGNNVKSKAQKNGELDKNSSFETPSGRIYFYIPPPPERLWSPPSLLANGYRGLFPWG
jgi:hypothetical protein